MRAGIEGFTPLFAGDTALMADSEEKLSKLMSESGKIYERRKLLLKLDKSTVKRYTRHVNGG